MNPTPEHLNPEGSPSALLLGEAEIALHKGEPAVELGGKSFYPDETTAWLKMRLSFGFPNVSWYGDGIHPALIAATFRSMEHKPLNISHLMKIYGENRDRIIGAVVAVEFPSAPHGGWKVSPDPEKSPYITAVACLWKQAEGADRIIGKHQGARHKYVVSQEVFYDRLQSGFAVQRKEKSERLDTTPEDMWQAGWNYIPVIHAPQELLDTRDWKNKRMASQKGDGSRVGRWKGSDVYYLYGGVDPKDTTNHYAGVGVVEHGAEKRADIDQMLAENDDAAAIAAELARIENIFSRFEEKVLTR